MARFLLPATCLVTDFHVRPEHTPAFFNALKRMTPVLRETVRATWALVAVAASDPQWILTVAEIFEGDVLRDMGHKPGPMAEALAPLLDEEWSGFDPYRAVHRRERMDQHGRALLAVRYRLNEEEREAYLAFERELTEQLFAIPGAVASYLLEHEEVGSRFLHLGEFTDLAQLGASVDYRSTDRRFLKSDRDVFTGILRYTHGTWEATESDEW